METPDQPPQTFGESLQDASKATSDSPIANSSTPPAAQQIPVADNRQVHTSALGNSLAHTSGLNGHPEPSRTSTHPKAVQEQVLLAHLAPLADPTLAAIPVPVTVAIPAQDNSTIPALQSSCDVSEQLVNQTDQRQTSSVQPVGTLTSQVQPSSSPFQTVLKTYFPDAQAIKAAVLPQTQPGLDETKSEAGIALQTLQSPDQSAVPAESQIGRPGSLAKQDQGVTSDAVSTTSSTPSMSDIQNTAPITSDFEVQNAPPNDGTNTATNNIPDASFNAVQSATLNANRLPEQSPLSQQPPVARTEAGLSAISMQAPEVAQPATKDAATSDAQSSFPKEMSTEFVNPVSTPTSLQVADTDQQPATSTIPVEVHNSSPKEVLQEISRATFSSSSNTASNPVDDAVPEVASNTISNATQNAVPQGTENDKLRPIAESISDPIASTTSKPTSSAAPRISAQLEVSAPLSTIPEQAAQPARNPIQNASQEQQPISVTSGSFMPDTAASQDVAQLRVSSALSTSVPIKSPATIEIFTSNSAQQSPSQPVVDLPSRSVNDTGESLEPQPATSSTSIPVTIAAPGTEDDPSPKAEPQGPSDPILGVLTKPVSNTAQSFTNEANSKVIPNSLSRLGLNVNSDVSVNSSPRAAAGSAVNSFSSAPSDAAEVTSSSSASVLVANYPSKPPSDAAVATSSRAASVLVANAPSNTVLDTTVGTSSDAAPVLVANSSSNSVSDAADRTPASSAVSVAANETQNAPAKAVLSDISSQVLKPVQDVVLSALLGKTSGTVAHIVAQTSPAPVPPASTKAVAISTTDSITDLVPQAGPVPRSHVAPIPQSGEEASAKKPVAETLNQTSVVPSIPYQSAPDDGATTSVLSVQGSATEQLVTLAKPSGGLVASSLSVGTIQNSVLVSGQSATGSSNGRLGGKESSTDQIGLTQHAQSIPDKTGKQTNSQDSTPSGDQGQGSPSSQVQSATPLQTNQGNQGGLAPAHAQTAGSASPVQAAPTLAGAPTLASKIPEHTSNVSTALPQVSPVINTAKLVQSMGQSEMRVGMRSTEFGNISISTSSTRDMISAQISLDHGELAKTLAASLPEMQTRLGTNQAMDVRINMNGTGTMNGAGTSSSMSNGSADQSRGGRQQAGETSSNHSGYGVQEPHYSSGRTAATIGDARINARLDITV